MENPSNNKIDKEIIEKSFRDIMEKGLGLDMNDENFKDSPKRFAKSYSEIFSGLMDSEREVHEILDKSFPTKYNGMVLEKGITVFSMCPHHFLPIRYEVSIAYIPNGRALGLSKLARIIKLMAKMPCLQEDFTERIVNEIEDHIKPLGVICVVNGAHYCMRMRGIEQKDSWTTTSSVRGVFKTKDEMELKYYNLLNNKPEL
ncbi:GTP cyclohydrolase I FolE [Candidatus Pacearchaeota archaeon CG10_big_fil_rev_8_21_14_0_10_32_42]|nr:MAG: GTP cyclohydrolase I FolE [Candidatus Pacearchaeota archaeon CG10_big_fil_rev_8_21_14_0_10_32_42]